MRTKRQSVYRQVKSSSHEDSCDVGSLQRTWAIPTKMLSSAGHWVHLTRTALETRIFLLTSQQYLHRTIDRRSKNYMSTICKLSEIVILGRSNRLTVRILPYNDLLLSNVVRLLWTKQRTFFDRSVA
jgi:hypothetical protein